MQPSSPAHAAPTAACGARTFGGSPGTARTQHWWFWHQLSCKIQPWVCRWSTSNEHEQIVLLRVGLPGADAPSPLQAFARCLPTCLLRFRVTQGVAEMLQRTVLAFVVYMRPNRRAPAPLDTVPPRRDPGRL